MHPISHIDLVSHSYFFRCLYSCFKVSSSICPKSGLQLRFFAVSPDLPFGQRWNQIHFPDSAGAGTPQHAAEAAEDFVENIAGGGGGRGGGSPSKDQRLEGLCMICFAFDAFVQFHHLPVGSF